jgi:hypothetical protein
MPKSTRLTQIDIARPSTFNALAPLRGLTPPEVTMVSLVDAALAMPANQERHAA